MRDRMRTKAQNMLRSCGYADGGAVKPAPKPHITGVPKPLVAAKRPNLAKVAAIPPVRLADGGAVKKNWIAGATKNKGALHRSLGVPENQKIPAAKLAKAANSKNPTIRKRAALAKTLGSFHK